MYNTHYRFRESPFSVTPDPQFYYCNQVYREAWASLSYGVQGRKGFVLIVGEAGTGKTTLLRKALREFPPMIRSAYVSNTLLGFTDLLRVILQDLGVPSPALDKLTLLDHLNRYLLEEFHKGNIVTLLIDEAQDLTVECLEELRLLGNLETEKHKLLQIVLVGQPGIEQKLHRPELLQLAQRIVLRCRIRPIDSSEVGPYIESRLHSIGRSSAEFFEPDALERIALYSRGIPRVINILCDNALLTAYASSKLKVDIAVVDEVAGDLMINLPQPQSAAIQHATSNQQRRFAWAGRTLRAIPSTVHWLPSSHRRSTLRRYPVVATLAITVLVLVSGVLYSEKIKRFDSSSVAGRAMRGAADHGQIAELQALRAPAPDPLAQDQQAPIAALASRGSSRDDASWLAPDILTRQTPQESPRRQALPKPPIRSGGAKFEAIAAPEKRSNAAPAAPKFSVVGASFVRSRPASNADIVATLQPGADINVVGRNGEYLRIRATGRESITGYVHREDAFFERKK